MKIAILGAGAFGTALGGILADNGYDVDYYDPKIEPENLSQVLEESKYILLAIPSFTVPHLLPHLPKNIPLIIATKGLLSEKIFAGFDDYMIISGPGYADDIKMGKPTKFTETDYRIEKIFNADFITYDYTDDVKGVLMCGALKNIYAIGAGFRDLKKDTPSWQEYVNAVAKEMKDILAINGADEKTVELACGVGDLKLTCDSPSRNFQFGKTLKKETDAKPDKTVEGYTALIKIKHGEIAIPESAVVLNDLMEKI